jgi:hypothetical protein
VVEEKRQPDLDALVWGLTLMAAGAILLSWDGRFSGWALLWRLWPLQLIAWGLASLLKGWRHGRLAGGGLLLAGTLLQLQMLGVVEVQAFWPLVLVAIGVTMAWNEAARRRPRAHERVE